jgi:monovalent cation:H+ antiporter, CPA1 family
VRRGAAAVERAARVFAMLDLAAILLVITALLAYGNRRFIGLPPTIGVMSLALALSLLFVGLDKLGISWLGNYAKGVLGSIDFSRVLMQGMLSFLLFAGALHVDLSQLRNYRWQVAILAVLGTVLSTALIGICTWYLLGWFGIGLPLGYCLVFGALISPTDPISVMGILKTAGAPPSVEVVIAGESLFNDGVGVVLFAVAVAMLGNAEPPSAAQVGMLLLRQAGGGIAFGLVLGYVAYFPLRRIDSYQEEVLITLAAVMGGYAFAEWLHVSGPLAMVVTGFVIGNLGRSQAMSETTRLHVDMMWELIDSVLNSVLFVLIGFEIMLLKFSPHIILPAAAVLMLTLGGRLVTVALPIAVFGRSFGLPAGTWKILTWGGLRGGISVALALSLPPNAERDLVVKLTYVIVVFSILVQGLTIGALVKRSIPCSTPRET